MKLVAISDLHLDYPANLAALAQVPAQPDTWLIAAGDLCTRGDHLADAWRLLVPRFARVFWVPGNHELWSSPDPVRSGEQLSGQAKYEHLVQVCRDFGVITPEDPFVTWTGGPEPHLIAPLFIPYDYSFRPAEIPQEKAVDWAMEAGLLCRDEKLINPTPFANMIAWCEHRLAISRQRLDEAASQNKPLVLINHFPLRQDLVRLWRIPRFSIWCGTKATENFHLDYPAKVVVSGHLHMRATDYRDGVRFEEVSSGYPRDWDPTKGLSHYLREILPGPQREVTGHEGPIWRFR